MTRTKTDVQKVIAESIEGPALEGSVPQEPDWMADEPDTPDEQAPEPRAPEEPDWLAQVEQMTQGTTNTGFTPATGTKPNPPAKGWGVVNLAQVRAFFGSIEWVWPSWIPKGHVTMIAGPQATGKSYYSAALAATLTGACLTWPDGEKYQGAIGHVVLVDTESMRGATAERLLAMGVKDDDVVLPVVNQDVTYISRLPQDLAAIERIIQESGANAVIIDSLSGGHRLDENSAAMGTLLQAFSALAARLQITVIVIHHVNKRRETESVRLTLDRVRGSTTITQYCRSVIGMYRLEERDLAGPVRIEPIKGNFCAPPKAIGMQISGTGVVFVDAPENDRVLTSVDTAEAFLRQLLQREPLRFSEVLHQAQVLGVGKDSLYRAKKRAKVQTVKGFWTLPPPLGGEVPDQETE